MSIQSDLSINVSKMKPENVPPSDKQMNDVLVEATIKSPKWWKVGAPQYRHMFEEGKLALPKPVYLDQAKDITIPSREKGREVPCRLLLPEHVAQVEGVYYHIHGGGWVLMSEKFQDSSLQNFANVACLAVVSVGYRLAPEYPYPQGPEDCYDVGEWLVDNAEAKFGARLKFVGGESAGAHLTALVAFHLSKARPDFALAGLVLNYGMFDLSMMPLLRNITRPTAVINRETMQNFVNGFLPNTTPEQRRDPSISPFYADLYSMKLPLALFLCGTEDCLLEDTVMMAARWQMAGGQCVMRLFAGAPHGFTAFPKDNVESAREGVQLIEMFLKGGVGS